MPINITIAVDPECLRAQGITTTGNFVITPALLHVRPSDQVSWTCPSPFVLDFKDGTPLTSRVQLFGKRIDDDSDKPSDSAVMYSTGPHNVADEEGHFHYAVAVFQNGRVFIDANCADLYVE